MNLIEHHRYGDVEGFRFGFGPIGPPMMAVYLYHVDGLLIDTAQRNMARPVIEVVRRLRPHHVLLTHHHEDHSGNAAAIRRACGAEVLGHRLTAQKMKRTRRIRPYQHFVWGRAESVPMTPVEGPIRSAHVTLSPIHTPGHSPDHTVYLEKERGWLFAGDLYLGQKIKYFRADERIADQINSLKAVLHFDFDRLFCGHNPVTSGGHERVRRKLEFLEDFLETVAALRRQGLPATRIIRRLDKGADRMVKRFTLGNASFANMVRSALRALEETRFEAEAGRNLSTGS